MKRRIMKLGERFEEEIILFLRDSGFKDVNGGRNFKINGIQIDAIGGFENELFIIECLSSQKRRMISVREKIKKLRGVIPFIKEGARNHKIYKKYSNLWFILALKNIIPTNSDRTFADKEPKILIWDDDFLEYYKKLTRSIGKYTVYNIMGELNISPRIEDKIIIPAFKSKIKDFTIYSFWINPKQLLKYSYVARRERKEEHYYQRFIDRRRIRKMAKEYIDKGKIYPNSIIISINEPCKFTEFPEWKNEIEHFPENLSFGILEFPKKFRSCWIIDGQHRLYSFAKSEKYHLLSVIAFERIPKIQQAEIFVDVNLNQKVVPPDLLWDLIGELSPSSEKGIISNVVKNLSEKGILKGRFYIPSFGPKRKGQLKFSGICQAIFKARLVKRELRGGRINPIYISDPVKLKDRLAKIFNTYFKLVEDIFTEELKKGFIFTNGGLAVMIYYLERIIRRVNRIPSKKDLKTYLNPLREYLEEAYPNDRSREILRLSCNSEGGRNNKLNEFVVNVAEKINDPKFAEGLKTPISELWEEIKKLESNLRKFIKLSLEREKKNWIEDLPPDIRNRIKDRLAKKTVHDKRSEEWQFLSLGECKVIIEKHWDKFENVFDKEFDSKDDFLNALNKLNKLRSVTAHGAEKYLRLSMRDHNLIKILIDKIEDCLKYFSLNLQCTQD